VTRVHPIVKKIGLQKKFAILFEALTSRDKKNHMKYLKKSGVFRKKIGILEL
jgi:hypothetical protein